ncbi:MAG TPA: hypothetical protein DHV14_08330 [Micrococcales bacterium]|uniref:Uncharacterized protein n=1 Tax=Miniimonas arenae TaxID=676201 RepID=A0A5C5BDJ4_9MICO|nr:MULTISPECIES: hypothetical protein [Miniimonas]TNU76258.1 hypothetical protein FH969_04000 [Miniimonas arenae]HCX85126.1 hypothetical protein [Micrococcales bacterium]
MNVADTALAVLRVLAAGLVFGAGLPALFSFGIVLWSRGTDEALADGSVRHGSSGARAGAMAVFAVVIVAVLIGVLWITRKSLDHYLGISLF